jgi:Ca2+-binding RTX toxin-like protein
VSQVIEQEDLLSKISQELINPKIPPNLVSNLSILIQPFNANNNQQQTTVTQINNSDKVQLGGGNGDDHIFGGSGDDILKGGPGKDFFDCNEGMDTVLDYNPKEDTVNTNCEEI